jgi:hypothetical protein
VSDRRVRLSRPAEKHRTGCHLRQPFGERFYRRICVLSDGWAK